MPIPTRSESTRTHSTALDETVTGDGGKSKLSFVRASTSTIRDRNCEQVSQLARPTSSRQTSTTANSGNGRFAQSISTAIERHPRQDETPGRSVRPPNQTTGGGVRHDRTQNGSRRGLMSEDRSNLPVGRKPAVNPHARTNSESQLPSSKIKPPFNNFKQHFSPRKPSSISQSSVNEGDRSSNPEEQLATSYLRQQLLHASCVHRDSVQILEAFERSVDLRCNAMFSDLRIEKHAVDSLCAERQALINADALHRWLYKNAKTARVNKLQDLDFFVAELANMTEAQGSFTTCMKKFDLWFGEVQDAAAKGRSQGHPQQIQPMCRSWSQCVLDLRSRLDVCKYTLSKLIDDDCPKDATLLYILRQHIQLAQVMYVSLDESAAIVQAITAHQQAQVAERIANLNVINEDAELQQPRRAAWQ